ncbi:Crp/Fnr family transcriptional regulator [Marinobacterium stanieri]|uniref:Transcriptional regulator, Crp/Fnr family n=1 Tax=Marinobacterium stanieri TaxID=49186 RepID=A0A1N6U3D6_9GAMM|nr:Crp/Fnr family transcriptional regulator [Marinobacterium stanieri]SIQ60132.1 transcriptional regulator, Crp/Fnr family [Marinobacterium stanieri]
MSDTRGSNNWLLLLPETVQKDVKARMVRRHFADGEAIYRYGEQGTTQYQVVSGAVRVRSLSDNGKEVTYVIYGPGECIGYLSAIDGDVRPQDAVAMGDVELGCLTLNHFEQLRERYRDIDRAMTLHLSRRMRELFKSYEVGKFFGLDRRLAHQIDFLLEVAEHATNGEGCNELELTQELLASSVSASRQAINKILKAWADAGVVEYSYGRIRILDRAALKALSEGEADSG